MGDPRCVYCGKIGGTKDHVIPKSVGGDGGWTNKVNACASCNHMKGAMTPIEFVRKMKEVLTYIEAHHRPEEDGSITLWIKK